MPPPLLDRELVVRLALRAIDHVPGAVVYADRAARASGTVQLGTQSAHTGSPSLLVFRDEMPGANWMHPCTYALVDIETGGVHARVASDRPPAFGRLPSTWIVVSDPEGKADLVTPSRCDP